METSNPKNITLFIRVPEQMKKAVHDAATERGQSMSSLCCSLLYAGLNTLESLKIEGLEEVSK